MGKKAPAAPDLSGFISAYKDLGNQYMGLANEQLAMQKERFAALDPLNMQMMQQQIESQQFANKTARENNEFYLQNYRPLEEQLINDAKSWNTAAEQDRMGRMAGSDVEQALQVQRGASMRALERMGVNPNSGRFMQLMANNGLQGAAMRAGAETGARFQARDQGFARMASVANMGRGYAQNTVGFMNAGTNAGQAGAGMMGAADKTANMYTQNAMNAMQGYGNTIAGGANITNQGFRNQMDAYNANSQSMGGVGQLIGMGAGMFFADGGMVRGPGTGTSDDVRAVNVDNGQPIRLSNGEYVLPAKTVREIGIDKLDAIVEKTNGKPPVHKRQRALAR